MKEKTQNKEVPSGKVGQGPNKQMSLKTKHTHTHTYTQADYRKEALANALSKLQMNIQYIAKALEETGSLYNMRP